MKHLIMYTKNKIWKKVLKAVLSAAAVLAVCVVILEYKSNYKASAEIRNDAPVKTKKTIVINAPIEKVWRIFCDVDKWSSWQKEISSSEINGSFKEGVSFDWQSNGLSIHSTLNTVNSQKKIVWSGPAFGSFAIHSWNFKNLNGRTLVEVNESMEGWLVAVFESKFQSGLDTSITHWLNDLKTESENIKIR